MAFGIKFAPIFIPLRRRLQTLIIFLASNLPFSGLITIIILYNLLFTQYYFVTLFYLAWWIFDHETPQRGGRRYDWFRRLPIWRLYAEYFPITLIKTADLSANGKYLFGLHPHGILCFSHSVNFLTEGTNFSELFPGIRPHLVTVNLQFLLPLQRELFLSGGACSASRE
ncbi:hypothetical protein BLA29_009837, partial [Euroglyphus maynei]